MTGQSGQFIRDLERRMSNRNEKLRTEKIELISLIKKCSDYKKQTGKYEEQLRRKYKDSLIDLTEYEKQLAETLRNRTAKEWANYYNDYILNYRNRIIEIDRELRQQETSQKLVLPVLIVALFMALLGLSYYLIQPQITGLTVLNGTNTTDSEFKIQGVSLSSVILNTPANNTVLGTGNSEQFTFSCSLNMAGGGGNPTDVRGNWSYCVGSACLPSAPDTKVNIKNMVIKGKANT